MAWAGVRVYRPDCFIVAGPAAAGGRAAPAGFGMRNCAWRGIFVGGWVDSVARTETACKPNGRRRMADAGGGDRQFACGTLRRRMGDGSLDAQRHGVGRVSGDVWFAGGI